MDFRQSDDNNLKGKFPRKLGIALGLPRSKDPLFSPTQYNGYVQVYEVYAGGPATRAGMRKGDIILDVGGTPVPKLDDAGKDPVSAVVSFLGSQKPGQVLHILVARDDKKVHLHVEL